MFLFLDSRLKNERLQHIDTNDLTKLLKELNGFEIVEGQPIKVQISTSRVRQHPGMDDPQRCYKYVYVVVYEKNTSVLCINFSV